VTTPPLLHRKIAQRSKQFPLVGFEPFQTTPAVEHRHKPVEVVRVEDAEPFAQMVDQHDGCPSTLSMRG
jgi:hypothetical protein